MQYTIKKQLYNIKLWTAFLIVIKTLQKVYAKIKIQC